MERCATHLLREAIGYCCECGRFGCEECLHEHEGQWYCAKHYQPIADAIAKQRKHEALKGRRERQRLLVHRKDGRLSYGVCYALNPAGEDFRLELFARDGEAKGKSENVHFEDLKAVFYVRSFDGAFDMDAEHTPWQAEGRDMVVEFEDGEVMRGKQMHSRTGSDARFYLIPADSSSNNLSVLVEPSFTRTVSAPDDYADTIERQRSKAVAKRIAAGESKAEALGTGYFEQKNYGAAVKYLKEAAESNPGSSRVRKKYVAALYNAGGRCIKYRQLERALEYLQDAAWLAPDNERVREKLTQLRSHIEKHKQASQG